MSSTAYDQVATPAAAFSGIAPTSFNDDPFPAITSTDPGDVFWLDLIAGVLNDTGLNQNLLLQLNGDADLMREDSIIQFSSSATERVFKARYEITIIPSDLAIVAPVITLDGSSGSGATPHLKSSATLDAPFVIGDEPQLDVVVTLNTDDDVNLLFRPIYSHLYKVHPVLSTSAGGGSVATVNGDPGPDVVITLASLGGQPTTPYFSAPWVLQDTPGGTYPARPAVFFPVVYYGWDEPDNTNTASPHVNDTLDPWFRRPLP